MYKLVSTDIDGTLLPYSKEGISEYTIDVIKKVIEKGVLVVPNSGRSENQLPKAFLDAGIRYIICTNGSIIRDIKENKTIFETVVNKQIVLDIYKYCEEHKIFFACYLNDECVSEEKWYKYCANLSYVVMKRTTRDVDNLYELIQDENTIIRKIVLSMDEKIRNTIVEDLKNRYTGLAYTSALASNIEIMNINSGKDIGLKKLCDYLNIKLDEAIALGDGDNDCPVLSLEKVLAIVPSNGNKNAIRYADIISDTDVNDGPAKELEKLILK